MSEQDLAINGGSPVRTEPWPARIQIGDEEVAAVNRVMEAAKKGNPFERYGGVEVDAYEVEFAATMGVDWATAVSAGTAAVHTAVAALRMDAGSEVICPPVTDPGGIMPVLLQNCIPIFADSYDDNFNMDPNTIEPLITDQTKAIIVAHIAGQMGDMDPIMEIAKKHNLYVIEDCAQAHYASYKGKLAGTIGDMGCFSTMSGKHTTSGGQGGMVITNNEDLYWNAKRFADRGKPFNSDQGSNLFLGINYRVTELAACIGREQLKKMAGITEARQAFAKAFFAALAAEDVVCVKPSREIEGSYPAYWFGTLEFAADKCAKTFAEYGSAVAAEGVPVGGDYMGALIPVMPWINNMETYGSTKEPWTSPHWKGDINAIDYANSVPNAKIAMTKLMRYGIHECMGEQEAVDMAKAIAKVDAVYRK